MATKQIGEFVVYIDGPLRHDLTPPDLLANGFIVREHRLPGKWCWWRRDEGTPCGQSYSAPYDAIDEVVANARHLMTAACWRRQGQLVLLEIEV